MQAWLNALPYNTETGGETLRTFRGVVAHGTAHCLEAALFAAVTLEQHGYPPLLLSFESIDRLDHVIFVYRGPRGWGSIARSRDPGLHGRRPVFATPRALALSYVDPYVDFSGRVRAYGVVHLAAMGSYDWRFATGNVWAVEQLLIDWPHHRIRTSDARYRRLKRRYAAYRRAHGVKPIYYRGRDRWMPLPAEFGRPTRRAVLTRVGARGGVAPPAERRVVAQRRAERAPRARRSVEVEVAERLGDRFLLGLLERLFEAPRQRVVAALLGLHRLLEDGLAAARLLLQHALRVVEHHAVARSAAPCGTRRGPG